MQGTERHGEGREKVGRRQGGSLRPEELFFLDQRDDPEEDDGADDGGDDLSHEGAAPMDAKPAEDVAADEAADDTDEEVNPKAEASTFHDFASQEACQRTDEDCDNDTHSFKNEELRIKN